jgi:hypothetical protein
MDDDEGRMEELIDAEDSQDSEFNDQILLEGEHGGKRNYKNSERTTK